MAPQKGSHFSLLFAVRMDSETQRAPSGRWPEYHVQQHDGHQGRCHGQREYVEAVVFHAPQLTGATARSCESAHPRKDS